MMNTAHEIFKIRKRFRMQAIPIYRLKNLTKELINGNVYESELQRLDKDEEILWYIEKKIRKRKRNDQIQQSLKCDRWPDTYNQWIEENDITEPNASNQ